MIDWQAPGQSLGTRVYRFSLLYYHIGDIPDIAILSCVICLRNISRQKYVYIYKIYNNDQTGTKSY